MGLLSRFEKKVPSTTDDPAAISTAGRLEQDPEKHEISQLEQDNESPNGNGTPYHVTPEIEKQVLRKLDTRLVPLVMVLCMTLNSPSTLNGNADAGL
jgi:MFS family permease